MKDSFPKDIDLTASLSLSKKKKLSTKEKYLCESEGARVCTHCLRRLAVAVTEGLGEARCHLAWLLLLAIGCRLLLLCFCLVVAGWCYCLVLFVAIVYRLLLLFAVCYLFVLCVAIVCCLLLLVVVCCSCLLFIVHDLLYFLGVAYGCYNLLMLFDGFPCIGVSC